MLTFLFGSSSAGSALAGGIADPKMRREDTEAVLARKAGVSLTSVKEAEDGKIRTVRVLLAVRILGPS